MSKIITIHSFQLGSGKSQLASNIAVQLATQGQRVALIDANIQSPSIQTLFGLTANGQPGLDDYLLGKCTIEDTVINLSESLAIGPKGCLYIVPSSSNPQNVTNLVRGGIPADALKSGLHELERKLQLDLMVIDTSAGLNEQTMVLMAMTNALAIVMLLDQRDYQGTATTIDVVQKLGVPRIGLIVNDVPAMYDYQQVQQEVVSTYHCPATVVPHSDELLALGGKGIFTFQYPDHPVTKAIQRATAMLLA
jgi:MinD-like ATPase involved in chromosome partitioning or flagellar assembly